MTLPRPGSFFGASPAPAPPSPPPPQPRNGGWIAVDLDGTLAHYDRWVKGQVGDPVPAMAARVREWLAAGRTVVIFTARVADADADENRALIEAWCEQHFGQRLMVTATKHRQIVEFYDDRAYRVEQNTGRIL